MARKKAKALPPKMITVYAEILQETEDAILVRCDDEADGVWLPKSQIEYAGERGDIGVEVQLPDWLADEKGFFDGMGYAPAQDSAVPVEPEQPETVTLYGSCSEENQAAYIDGQGVVFTVEYEDASIEYSIPRDQIVDLHIETSEEAAITVSRAYAIEAGMIDVDAIPAPSEPQTNDKRAFGDNVKWLKEESITVLTPLSDAEKARYAEDMAALDKEIEELEDERADVSSRLKKQIDAKEQERREMSAHVNDGESRTISCDCLKDYNTGEMVWTNAYPPYDEVQRRKMTKEEMQPSLLEFENKQTASAPGTEGMDFDALADDAPADGQTESRCRLCKWNGSEHCPDCFCEEMFEPTEDGAADSGEADAAAEDDAGATEPVTETAEVA